MSVNDVPCAGGLALERFFAGRVTGRGRFVSSLTGAARGLSVVIDGTYEAYVLTLNEAFAYDDGETDQKTWRLLVAGERRFVGTRDDVIGLAKVWPAGRSMRMDYVIALKTKRWGDIHVRFRDVLTPEADGTVTSRARVSKWGLTIGRVELRMERTAPEARPGLSQIRGWPGIAAHDNKGP